MLINSCDQIKMIICQFKRLAECFRGAQAGKDENLAETNNVTSMMGVQQVHKFQNFSPMPLNTVLLADYKVYHPETLLHVTWQVVDWPTADIHIQLGPRGQGGKLRKFTGNQLFVLIHDRDSDHVCRHRKGTQHRG